MSVADNLGNSALLGIRFDPGEVSRYRGIAMPRLITTNLRFPEATYRELRYQAGRRNVPLALLVREAVDRYLGRTEEAAAMPLDADPADAIIGSVTGGPDDESVNHDHYLYGLPKQQ